MSYVVAVTATSRGSAAVSHDIALIPKVFFGGNTMSSRCLYAFSGLEIGSAYLPHASLWPHRLASLREAASLRAGVACLQEDPGHQLLIIG